MRSFPWHVTAAFLAPRVSVQAPHLVHATGVKSRWRDRFLFRLYFLFDTSRAREGALEQLGRSVDPIKCPRPCLEKKIYNNFEEHLVCLGGTKALDLSFFQGKNDIAVVTDVAGPFA